MSDPKPLTRPRPPPPRIDESKVSQPLQDLFAGWRVALREPFVGLTADGTVEPNIFAPAKTGVSTQPLVAAANAFLASLSEAQHNAVSFDVDGEVWRTWSNIHRNLMRHGLCMAELSESQRELAYGVLRAGLGQRAYETARNAMRLNETLAEMTGIPEEFGEYFYWISIFGEPSADEPWGWQMDGHHCNVNCFVLGDQIVLSPMLLGSEPVTAEDGVYKGLTVLREEEAEGWAFMAALTPEQRTRAIVGTELPFDGYASGFKDNLVVPYAGLQAADMSASQRVRLLTLLRLYIDRLPASHAPLRFDEVTAHLDRTWFGWIGEFNEIAPFYYRIHSPMIFVEFYHQPGVALPNTGYNRRHAHALVRTPNGNDYGRVLLRAYRAKHAADAAATHR
ncbi:MAG: DUF3500 domain-containing protein [Pseudolabrys sp.]